MDLDFIAFGEPLYLFYAKQTGNLEDVNNWGSAIAGAETNFVTGVSRLGHKSGLITKLGDDSLGRFIIKKLKEENINTANISISKNHKTGLYLKSKTSKGDPDIEYFRKNSAASTITIDDFNKKSLNGAKLLHMTSIFASISKNCQEYAFHVASEIKKMGSKISFDPNLRDELWERDEMVEVINQLAKYADIIIPGLDEGKILTGYSNPRDISKFYLDKGVELVVLTDAKGAHYATAEEFNYIEGFDVDVVDTVGAGDGFSVGLNTALIEGLSIEEAVLRGNAIGARQVTYQGDSDGLPTRKELEEFMKKTSRI